MNRYNLTATVAATFILLMFGSVTQATSSKWEKDISNFEMSDKHNPPPLGATLFIGSSSIRLWKSLSTDFSPHPVINRGFGGAQTDDVLEYMDRIVIPYKPKNIVFYCGGNDVANGKNPAVAVKNLKVFVERVREVLPQTKIYVLSMKPSPLRLSQWPALNGANQARKIYAEGAGNVEYIDVSHAMFNKNGELIGDIFIGDRLHLNDKGYEIWTKIVKAAIDW